MIWNAMLPITNCCTGALNMMTASTETGMSPDEQTPLVQAFMLAASTVNSSQAVGSASAKHS